MRVRVCVCTYVSVYTCVCVSASGFFSQFFQVNVRLSNVAFFVIPGMPLSLDCKAFFGYSGESRHIIYWMKGEKFVEELAGHIKESEVRYCI